MLSNLTYYSIIGKNFVIFCHNFSSVTLIEMISLIRIISTAFSVFEEMINKRAN